MSTQTTVSFPSLQDFYDQNPNRLTSPEADYGVHWRLSPWPNSWRVSYVQKTGEIYAVHSGYPSPGPVMLLGTVPTDPQPNGPAGRETYYHTLDRILQGYPDHCGPPNGLAWVQQKLQEYQGPVPPTFDPNAPIYNVANAQEVLNTVMEHLMGDHDGNYPRDQEIDELAPSLKESVMQAIHANQPTPCNHVFADIEDLAHQAQDLIPTDELQAIRKSMGL